MAISIDSFDKPFPVSVAISPSKADSFAQCPRRYACQYLRRASSPDNPPSLAQQRGQLIHRALAALNRELLRSPHPDIDTLIERVRPPAAVTGDGPSDDLAERIDRAMRGYASYLADGTVRVRAVEQFIPTPPRRIAGHPGVAVVLAGKVDAILERFDGDMIALDFKTGATIPLLDELCQAPSSAIYTLLVDYWLPNARSIEITHLLPHIRETVSVRLTEEQIENARAVVRRMAVALASGTTDDTAFPPTAGEQCGTCRWVSSCPAHDRPGWGAEAF